MNQKYVRLLLVLGFALPTAIGVMYLDCAGLAGLPCYLLIFLVHGLLCRWGIKTGSGAFVILGNLAGLATNYAVWRIPHPEKWRYYFKCSPSSDFLFLILGVSFAVQLWFLFRDYAERNWTKE